MLNNLYLYMEYAGSITQTKLPTDIFFKKLDLNKSKKLEYTEFLACTCSLSQILTEANLKEAFNIISDNKDIIRNNDLKEMFGGGVNCHERVWE